MTDLKPCPNPWCEALAAALEPFADAAMHLHPSHPDDGETLDGFTVAEFRKAYAALAAYRSAKP